MLIRYCKYVYTRYVCIYVNLLLCVRWLPSEVFLVLSTAVHTGNSYGAILWVLRLERASVFDRRNFEPFSRYLAMPSEVFFVQQCYSPYFKLECT